MALKKTASVGPESKWSLDLQKSRKQYVALGKIDLMSGSVSGSWVLLCSKMLRVQVAIAGVCFSLHKRGHTNSGLNVRVCCAQTIVWKDLSQVLSCISSCLLRNLSLFPLCLRTTNLRAAGNCLYAGILGTTWSIAESLRHCCNIKKAFLLYRLLKMMSEH